MTAPRRLYHLGEWDKPTAELLDVHMPTAMETIFHDDIVVISVSTTHSRVAATHGALVMAYLHDGYPMTS